MFCFASFIRFCRYTADILWHNVRMQRIANAQISDVINVMSLVEHFMHMPEEKQPLNKTEIIPSCLFKFLFFSAWYTECDRVLHLE